MNRYELLPNRAGGGGPVTQNLIMPEFAGPVRIPPENFQPRVRKEVNTRDTVNARHVEDWNARVPIQQAEIVRFETDAGIMVKTPKKGANFDKLADAYRVISADDADRFRVTIDEASIPGSNDAAAISAFIKKFMKIVDVYDMNNGLYLTGALMDFFPTQTDRKDFLNLAIEKEKKAIGEAIAALFRNNAAKNEKLGIQNTIASLGSGTNNSGSNNASADFKRQFKQEVVEALRIQRRKNIEDVTNPKYAKMDSKVPKNLQTVYQDMAPLSSRTDIRDFRQSKPYDSSGPNLSLNPFFDRYDPTRDPRNMVREVRSAVYEPKEADRGIEESERIRARTFTNRYQNPDEAPVALTEWYNLMRPKFDNPEIIYRKQTPLEKIGGGV